VEEACSDPGQKRKEKKTINTIPGCGIVNVFSSNWSYHVM